MWESRSETLCFAIVMEYLLQELSECQFFDWVNIVFPECDSRLAGMLVTPRGSQENKMWEARSENVCFLNAF